VVISPFAVSIAEIERALAANASLLPELLQAQASDGGLGALPPTQQALADTAAGMAGLKEIPPLPYSLYRAFGTTGRREPFGTPYWLRRQRVTALALRMLLGAADLHEPLEDYLWAICEETTWTEPWHEGRTLCLSSASTAVTLAETRALLREQIAAEVRHRVYQELDRRVFTPYLGRAYDLDRSWGAMNWNSVCNSGIGMAFLAAEPDQGRVALAVHQAINGLRRYLEEGFAPDGSTSEGVGYWHYGMSWLVLFAETLRARTAGAIDLLSAQRIRQIAAYPAKMRLAGRQFATFSDSPTIPTFQSGIMARLAERSGERSLYGLGDPNAPLNVYDVPGLLRDMLWRREAQPPPPVDDALLPSGGLIRLVSLNVSSDANNGALVLMAKAGHNDEHHNHNDVGSFILHCDGEDLLVDPGAGAYNRDYFNERRYENPFASSYGHSVPRVGGLGQGVGAQFRGEIIAADLATTPKRVQIAFHHAYPEECGLSAATREFTLHGGMTLILHDRFDFSTQGAELEEALVTWGEVEINGTTAWICGERHGLHLTIEEPTDVCFALETLTEASLANERKVVLKRLTATAAGALQITFRIRMEITSLP
jgi:hypothetical protein